MPSALHSDLFPCTKCPEHFNSRDQQAKHLRVFHGVEDPWLCYRCPLAFPDRARYMEHMTQGHRGKGGLSPCGDCRAQLTSDDMLARHVQHDHTEQAGREESQCLKCDFSNNSCVGISIHLLHEHAPRCSFCGMGFIRMVDLALHEEGNGVGGECSAKPKPRAPTPPPPTPPPPPSPTAYLPPLPDFAALDRPDLTPQDFDPKTVYQTTIVTIRAYRPCPKEVPYERLFNADPKMLAYGNILRLAGKYSNRTIFERANASRSQPAFNSVQTVESRIAAALKWTANNNAKPLEEIKAKLDEIRAGNGTATRRALKRSRDDFDVAPEAQHYGMQPYKHIKTEDNMMYASPYQASAVLDVSPAAQHHGMQSYKHIKTEGSMVHASPYQAPTGFDVRVHSGSSPAQNTPYPRYDTPAAAGGFIKEEGP
ncbi:hypothetical protein LTR65_010478 [Meristemomyces frigidus]